ncbi:BtaA family protein [Frankia sp. AgB32]|nr:BtaA family protein [Frankia sp. AgB32]
MEDWWVIKRSLQIQPGDTVVTIASGGDNAFNAACTSAAEVIAVDVSSAQIELCKAKQRLMTAATYGDFAVAMGYQKAPSHEVHRILDQHAAAVPLRELQRSEVSKSGGLAAFSHLEEFLEGLRRGLATAGDDALRLILNTSSPSRRLELWEAHLAGPSVVSFLDDYLADEKISGAFIPSWAFPMMAEVPFSHFFHNIMFRQMVTRYAKENYFFSRLVSGAWSEEAELPEFARPDSFDTVRQTSRKIQWVVADLADALESLPPRSVDAINLSNILDWCDEESYLTVWQAVSRVSRPGARVFLRSFLRERALPECAGGWNLDSSLSKSNISLDRIGYYSRYESWTRPQSTTESA